ncbi:MAG: FkbM family methyltransferase [Candidatus Marinimicrobia bacterium]|nr:FkbM family methyltransferase [Candidatus Neomarinimicrobiota bacterium]
MKKDYLRWVLRAWRYRLIVEKQEISFMLKHLKPGQTAIDIGAHKGAYTYWMSKYTGANGNVFAFEPQPRLYNQLNKILDHSKINNVHVELLALSANKGEGTLLMPGKKTSPSASIHNKNLDDGVSTKINVKTTTLDNYFCGQNHIPVHFIKCDVEGHELEVLMSGQKLLNKFQPIIVLESEARHCGEENVLAVFDLLDSNGYDGFFFNGKSMSHLKDFDIYEFQLDPNKKKYVNNFFFISKSTKSY